MWVWLQMFDKKTLISKEILSWIIKSYSVPFKARHGSNALLHLQCSFVRITVIRVMHHQPKQAIFYGAKIALQWRENRDLKVRFPFHAFRSCLMKFCPRKIFRHHLLPQKPSTKGLFTQSDFKLTQVYYSAVWISTSITSIKYHVTCQFLYLIFIYHRILKCTLWSKCSASFVVYWN